MRMGVYATEFPAECDIEICRSENPELASFSPHLLEQHYRLYGAAEGRSRNALKTRADFFGFNLVHRDGP